MRVDAKHHGIQPARDECDRVALSVREFFDEVASSVLGVNFATVSAIDLLEEGEIRETLLEAKAARENNNLMDCIVGCRKAIYLQFEHKYDIGKFKDGEPKGLFAAFSDAPFYARNKEYIEKNVRDPTDFIVLDHGTMDQELLKKGVDTTAFWNVWRLTPEIYRSQDHEWIVKHDFDKLDDNLLADKADYVLATTIDIFLAIGTAKRMERLQDRGRHFLNLAREGVPVYRKADRKSEVIATTPSGITKIWTEFYVTGLDGSGPYWSVYHMEKDLWFHGYISNDDVE